jgi:hypothetical protein
MISQKIFDRAQVVLSAAVDRGSELTEFENDFISGLVEKLEQYGLDSFLSDKQMAILARIAAKLEV